MSAPYRFYIVRHVHETHPHLLRYNTAAACGEFLQRVIAALPADERWGLLSKTAGERHHTYPNGHMCAVDVIALPDGRRVDIINGSDNHPTPAGPTWIDIPPYAWRPHNVYTDTSNWPIFDSGTPRGDAPATVARLGFGWFCFMRAFQDWRESAQQNLNWIEEHVNPDCYRVMIAVEGRSHGDPDPWLYAGVPIDAPWWRDRYREMLEILGARGKQAHITVYGGRNQTPTREDCYRFHDRIIEASDGLWGAIRSFEVANEYTTNRWVASEIRDLGRDLRIKLPVGTKLSLSTPELQWPPDREPSNEEMQEAIDVLYREQVASELTIHRVRDRSLKWFDHFAYNPLSSLPKIDNEPMGPGASAGGNVADPALLLGDYKRASEAGWALYVGHSAWSVFNGRLPDQYRRPYDVFNVWEHDNMESIAHAFREFRQRGVADPPPPPAPPSPPRPPAPDVSGAYPDENTWWPLVEREIVHLYAEAYRQGKRETPDLDPAAFRWFARIAYDVGAYKMDKDASADKHFRELKQELRLS